MKKLLTILIMGVTVCESCTDTHNHFEMEFHAQEQMEKKVNDVTLQLREDCDSSILKEAKWKVDSIRKQAATKRKTKR